MKQKNEFPSFKKRHAIIDFEKKSFRDYYFDSVNEKFAHKILRDWFYKKFQHLFFQSTISESLFVKFIHLNTDLRLQSEHKKQRIFFWSNLKAALFE